MDPTLSRRQALAAIGALGTTIVLAACSDDDGGLTAGVSTGAATTATTATTASAGAATTTTSAAAADTGDLAALFEDANRCAVTTELTEGPYYIDADLVRSDIREDREGQALRVGIRVLDAACAPLPGAVVEIWHCDAVGSYSGFESASAGGGGGGPGGPPGGGGSSGTDATRYLRGGQVTDDQGIAAFTTVYPGWYRGRTVHIHAKVLMNDRDVLTTQLFFDESLTEEVYAQAPYAADTGRTTFNEDDGIFDDRLVLTTSQADDAYLGLITFVVS